MKTDKSRNQYLKAISIATFVIFITVQLGLVIKLQLFGDEAFYWLESQHLDWSYSELPGWTAWMIRLGTNLLGHSYFSVRFVSYLGFLSVFIVIWKLNRLLNPANAAEHNSYLLVGAVPLLMLIAVMALPDIWLIFFVMWVTYFLIKSIKFNKVLDWFIVGLILALSLNVHVRMWMWLFFAGLVFIYVFRTQIEVLKPALTISLPIALLGIVPVMFFNYQHEFVMFSFQFGRRNPWKFQSENISFLLSQIIVITPVVLYLWFKNIQLLKQQLYNKPIFAWILITAFLHWLFYVVMSLFSDGLRTTVHWVLISYVPVLSISTLLIGKNTTLIKWATVTGGLATLFILLLLSFKNNEGSNLQARLFDNSLGWHELSVIIKRIQKQQQTDIIITDYFMTAAEIAFELNETDTIKVLPHQKSVKHGRQKQLQYMGMLLDKPQDFHIQSLLIVEDSTLKLQDKGRYYAQICDYFQSLKYLETINPSDTNKQFHIFMVNHSQQNSCEIPPLFYAESIVDGENIKISGWAILNKVGLDSLVILSGKQSFPIFSSKISNTGIAQSFPEIDDPNAPNNGFTITIPMSQIENKKFTIKAVAGDGKIYYSQIHFLD